MDWPYKILSREGLGTVLHRAQALELCRDPVVLYQLVERRFQCVSAKEPDVVEEFFFEVAEEVLHHRVVVAVALAGH